MYRCGCCNGVSKPGEPLHKHIIYREVEVGMRQDQFGRDFLLTRKEIEREVPVCAVCARRLSHGHSFDYMKRFHVEKAMTAPALSEKKDEDNKRKSEFESKAVKLCDLKAISKQS